MVGKVIHWEMCKKFKVDHTKKWYLQNPAAVLENDIHKLLWDFNIQTDRSPNIDQKTKPYSNRKQKKRNCKFVHFAVPADKRIKRKESEKKNKYLDLARELKETMEH